MSTPNHSLEKRLAAEFLGTFILVFVGTFSVVTVQSGPKELAVGLAFAAAAIGAIYAFGHISGTHINPVVTLSLAIRGKFPWKEAVPYALTQIIGAIVAAFANYSIVGRGRALASALGATSPSTAYGVTAALAAETITTFILIITVLGATEKEAPSGFAGIAIGLILGLNVTIDFNVSGGSMNPARSLGPVVALLLIGVQPNSPAITSHWIYWIGPILGSVLAALVHWVKS